MQSFKQFLNESKFQTITIPDDQYLSFKMAKEYLVDPDIIYNISGKVMFDSQPLQKLPFKFNEITDSFSMTDCGLISFDGFPKTIMHNFWCDQNKISSFENCPEYVNDAFNCSHNSFTSLVGIHKYIKHCKTFNCTANPIKEGGLGLLLIDGLETIQTDHIALQIIRMYLGQGKKGMMQCQAELIEKGYEEYAKI